MENIELIEADVPGASLENPPEQCSNALLKRWLKCHGLSQVGVKAKLVDRVNLAIASGKKVIPGIDEGKWYVLKKDKLSKDKEIDDTDLHHAFPTQGWKSFPSRDVPKHFTHGHIYHHIVESISSHTRRSNRNKNSDSSSSCSDDGYATTAKPFEKGQRLMESGFAGLQKVSSLTPTLKT